MPPIGGDYDTPLLMNIDKYAGELRKSDGKTLTDIYEHTAKACSTMTAIKWPENDVTLTYSELLQESTSLSNVVLSHTVPLRRRIVLFLPQSIMQIFSVLATLQSTCAYVPICASTPAKRVAHILSDCKPDCIITVHALKAALVDILPLCTTHTWAPALDKLASCGTLELLVPATQPITPQEDAEQMGEHVAYILYTSGTTGLPKGCVVSHQNVVSYIDNGIKKWYNPTKADRVLFSANYAFDTSVEIMWTCWASGAALVGASKEIAVDARDAMPEFMSDQGITIWSGTPTQLRDLTPAQDKLVSLRLAIVGGEVCGQDVANAWGSKVVLLNTYGPTECTVIVTAARVVPNAKVPIGAVFPGLGYHVVDDKLHDVAAGEKGELLIKGEQVCLGYLNRPDLTSQKFVLHPGEVSGGEKQRQAYRTGDLVSVGEKGSLNFHGRIDGMVKIAGQRIELGEIETSLLSMEDIASAVVVAQKQTETSTPVLVAFIEFTAGRKLSGEDRCASTLRKLMRQTLPSYMIPQHFVLLAAHDIPRAAISQKTLVAQLPKYWEIPKEQMLPAVAPGAAAEAVDYASPLEKKLCDIFGHALGHGHALHPEMNFFDEGGNSSFAGVAITLIRRETCLTHVTIRELYKNPSPRSLATVKPAKALNHDTAELLRESLVPNVPADEHDEESTGLLKGNAKITLSTSSTRLFMLGQACFFLWHMYIGAVAMYFFVYHILTKYYVNTWPVILAMPCIITVLSVLSLPFLVMWYRIHRYVTVGQVRPKSFRHRSYTHFLHWCLLKEQQMVVAFSAAIFGKNTPMHLVVLRGLGAHIGKRVHVATGSDLVYGPLELLHIGDDVSMHLTSRVLTQDLVGDVVTLGNVFVGARSTMGVSSVINQGGLVAEDSYIAANAYVLPGQHVPAGVVYSGSPAQYVKKVEPINEAPVDTDLGPYGYTAMVFLWNTMATSAIWVPTAYAWNWLYTVFAPATGHLVGTTVSMPLWVVGLMVTGSLVGVCVSPFMAALYIRLLPKVTPGVYHTFGFRHFVMQSKMNIIRVIGSFWSATMLWPSWLWLCGAKIGSQCELDNVEMIPELVTTGDKIFCADPFICGVPIVSNGLVEARETVFGSKTFTGGQAYVVGGSTLPDNVLIGVYTTICTCTSSNEIYTPGIDSGTAWMGNPAYPMQRPTQGKVDESQLSPAVHLRAARFVFEYVFRPWIVTVPVFAYCMVFNLFPQIAGLFEKDCYDFIMGLFLFPALTFVCGLLPPLSAIVAKWFCLGTVKAGDYNLYDSDNFVNRWSCVYTHDRTQQTSSLIGALLDTDFYRIWLRCMGAEIGHDAVVRTIVTHDHDMLHMGSGSKYDGTFQAHTFEERTLKMGHIRLGHGAKISTNSSAMAGSAMEDGSHVIPCSVVHKGETLAAHRGHAGNPTTAHEAAISAAASKGSLCPPGVPAQQEVCLWVMHNIV